MTDEPHNDPANRETPEFPRARYDSFQAAVETAINRHSMENGSNTPDFMLASFLTDCLRAWDPGIAAREAWYGRAVPGHDTPDQPEPLGGLFALGVTALSNGRSAVGEALMFGINPAPADDLVGLQKALEARGAANVVPGEIVQILGHHKWAFCLAVVDEVRSWGVQAYVRIPHNDGTEPGNAFIRLDSADFEPLGVVAPWRPAA